MGTSMGVDREIPNTNEIMLYLHCGLCLDDIEKGFAPGLSPKEYARVQVGWTPLGIQVWCNRHDVNIVHIDFEGQKHPADDTRPA